MAGDVHPIGSAGASKAQILDLAAQEMQRWKREQRQQSQRKKCGAGKALIICGVAILLFLSGYLTGRFLNLPASSGSTGVHETTKH